MSHPLMPIPDDWNGEDWTCVFIDWPDSEEWLALLRGFVSTPQRGRFWDGRTGSILAALEVGQQIADRNGVIVSCQDLVLALQAIQAAVEGIDINVNTQATATVDINNTLIANNIATNLVLQSLEANLVSVSISGASAQAEAFAWSQAIAQNFVGVHIDLNVPMQMRPIAPTSEYPDPTLEEKNEAGINSALQSDTAAEQCKRVFWLVYSSWKFWEYIQTTQGKISGSVLSWGGAIADALTVVGLQASPSSKAIIMPASILLQASHLLGTLWQENVIGAALTSIVDFHANNLETIVCEIYCKLEGDQPTDVIQDAIEQLWVSFGANQGWLGLIRATYPLNALAFLYYTSPLISSQPAIPAPYTAICDFCACE